jgi:hypothetical protein
MELCRRHYDSAQKEDDSILIEVPPGPACQWLNFHSALSRTLVIDELVPGLECPQIMSDDKHGMCRLVKYLIGLGHRKIAHIGAESKSSGTMPAGSFVIPTELKIRESCYPVLRK